MAHEALSMIGFSDRPAVLVLADSEAGGERARRSAELAGCRVSDIAPIAGAVDRIGQQAAMDAILVEIGEDHGSQLDTLLERLEAMAAGQGRGSIISAPVSLIDPIAARTPSPLIQHLCDAPEFERVAAIAFASARPKQRLHDIGKEQGLPRLQQLSQEVERIAGMLAALAAREGRGEQPGSVEGEGEASPVDAGLVRAVIRARRLRDQYFGPDLFADPAWDILLDLFAAQLEQQRVAVSSLCIAAAVPATTALRWIKTLTDLGLLVRSADPQDGRRVYIELAPNTAAGLEAYLQAAQRISPSIL